jgi:predicted DNA-binding transcriptional regulator AlpA
MSTIEPADGIATVAGRNDHRTATTDPEHLTLDETAEWLRCSTRTPQRLIETGSGPPVIRLSERRLIFRLADLRQWLGRRTTGRTEIAPPRRRGRPPKLSNTQAVAP